MTFTPISERNLRIVYSPERRAYDVQEVFIRRRNGATQREDLAGIENLDQESWRTVANAAGIEDATKIVLKLMLTQNVDVRSIDLGPGQPTDPAVVNTITELLRIVA